MAIEVEPVLIEQKQPSILWISNKSDKNLDLIFRGFEHAVSEGVNIEFIDTNSETYKSIGTKLNSFDFVVTSNDEAWEKINTVNNTVSILGVGISQHIIDEHSKVSMQNQYFISKEQTPQRIFAMLTELDLNHVQAAAFFNKYEMQTKSKFVEQGKLIGYPFKPIFIKPNQNLLETIVSVEDCCRVLFLKKDDFKASEKKQKALLIESYRRRIVTISNRSDMLSLGAMYVIYTPDHMLGIQAANSFNDWRRGNPIKSIQEPEEFVIDSNPTLRKLIGGFLDKKSIGDLTNRIKLSESVVTRD